MMKKQMTDNLEVELDRAEDYEDLILEDIMELLKDPGYAVMTLTQNGVGLYDIRGYRLRQKQTELNMIAFEGE